MRRISLLCLLLPCLIFACRIEAGSVSLMTYNIKAARNLLPAEQGLELIAQVIETRKPDVLLLQEVMRFDPYVDYIDEFQWLKDRLEYPDGRFASGKQDPVLPGTAEWGVAIYLASGSIISSEKYRIGNGRALLRVTVSIGNTVVHLFCTHLGSGEIPLQAELVAEILSDYTTRNEPVVLGGDFNAQAESDALSPLRESLEDVFITLSMPTELRRSYPSGTSPEDAIATFFVSPEVTVLAAEVILDQTLASDHNPVTCIINPGANPDFDRDGDVDQADFGRFQACMSGPTTPQTDPACRWAKLDGDADVDQSDFDVFRQCLSGPDVPADPNCAG